MGHQALRGGPPLIIKKDIKANRRTEEYRMSNVEGMYSVYFIKKKKAGIRRTLKNYNRCVIRLCVEAHL